MRADMNVFQMNSPLMRGIRKIVELMYIGMLWFICSIPLVTLGAATAALYEVLLKAVKNQEGYLFKSFLRAFQNNFKQGTCIWLPIALAEVLFSVNLFYYGVLGGGNFVLQTVVFSVLLVLVTALSSYVFPIIAKFENTAMGHVRMAATLALRNPGWTAALVVIQILTLFAVWFFIYFPLLFIMGFSGYVQAVIFNHIFDRLIENGMIIEENGQRNR